MKEFLEIIYYVVQSVWPILFLALVYLIWKDVNRIAAHIAPEYYYDDEDGNGREESNTEPVKEEPAKEEKAKSGKNSSGKSPSDDEFIVEDLEL